MTVPRVYIDQPDGAFYKLWLTDNSIQVMVLGTLPELEGLAESIQKRVAEQRAQRPPTNQSITWTQARDGVDMCHKCGVSMFETPLFRVNPIGEMPGVFACEACIETPPDTDVAELAHIIAGHGNDGQV